MVGQKIVINTCAWCSQLWLSPMSKEVYSILFFDEVKGKYRITNGDGYHLRVQIRSCHKCVHIMHKCALQWNSRSSLAIWNEPYGIKQKKI